MMSAYGPGWSVSIITTVMKTINPRLVATITAPVREIGL